MTLSGWEISGLIAVLALIAYVLFWWSRQNRALRAERSAQEARESDELDLDHRLGKKETLEIESRYKTPCKVAFRRTGHGKDILCLHGIGASMMIYRRLVPWLSGDHRLTCLDFPGFGSSDKPRNFDYSLDEQAEHLKKTIEALGLDRPLVVASSMGGAIALKAALDTPSLFSGIVALAPAVDPKRIPIVLLPLAKYGNRLHRISSQATVKAVLSQVIGRRELITPSLVALYQEPFRDDGASSAAFMSAFRLLADKRMPVIFRDLPTPLLIVRGLRDRLVKQGGCEDLRRLVPDSLLVTHPSAGHHIMEDEPEFIAREIRKFYDTRLDVSPARELFT